MNGFVLSWTFSALIFSYSSTVVADSGTLNKTLALGLASIMCAIFALAHRSNK